MSGYAEKTKRRYRKTIEFDRITDAEIITWFNAAPNASEVIRTACHFYLAHQRQAPAELAAISTAQVDLQAIRNVMDQALADCVVDMRQVVQSVIEQALGGQILAGPAAGGGNQGDEIEALLARLDDSLDLEQEIL